MDFNPNATETLGEEWFPHTVSGRSVDADDKGIAVRRPSTAAETVDTADVYLRDVVSSGLGIVEVYEDGDEICGPVTTDVFVPNGTVLNEGNNWRNPLGTTANLPTYIDGYPGAVDLSSYITFIGKQSTTNRTVLFNIDTAAWPAGRRVLDVRLHFWANTQEHEAILAPRGPSTMLPERYRGQYNGLVVGTTVEEFVIPFGESYLDDVNARPYRQADVAALDGAESGLGFTSWSGRSRELRIYQAWVEVDWVVENRVAWGTEYLTKTAPLFVYPDWQPVALEEPDATPGFPKANGTDYVYTVRRFPSRSIVPSSSARFTIGYLAGDDPPPIVDEAFIPTLSDGCVSDLGDVRPIGVPLVLMVGGNPSVDSQPYSEIAAAPVNTVGPAAQLIDGAAADDYDLVRAVIRREGETVDDLEIRVRRESDDVQIGGTRILSAADVDALPAFGPDWRYLDVLLPAAATLAPATVYYVEFSSAAPGDSEEPGYSLAYLSTDPDYETVTYGGDTICMRHLGADIAYADALVLLSTTPDPPTGFRAETGSTPFVSDGTDCAVEETNYADLR